MPGTGSTATPSESGQALVMVTLALLAMCGLIGMAVDFGWSFYVRRAAQAAADSAALAAASHALDRVASGAVSLTCGAGGLSCPSDSSPAECAGISDIDLAAACQYAGQNGFRSGGDNNRQSVQVSAGLNTDPGHPAGVQVHYWVTVRVTNTIPQLYSAVLGNAQATVAARATAAIVDAAVSGSLIGLGRTADPFGPHGAVDLRMASGSRITAPNGILLSSLDPGAGTCLGCTSVDSSLTLIRSQGSTRGGLTGAPPGWAYQNQGESAPFWDPMANLGQPPLTTSALPPIPVPGGILRSDVPGCCGPGAYFATQGSGDCPNCASGAPIVVGSTLSFSPASGANFGDFVFFGGLNITSGAAPANFGPGRYVFAGVDNPNNSACPPVCALSIQNQSLTTGGTGSDAGRLFILTDATYPGLNLQVNQVNAWLGVNAGPGQTLPALSFGQSSIGGVPPATPATGITLNGLNPSMSLPGDANAQGSSLTDYGNQLIWQDQRFSNVAYTASGKVDTSCSSLDAPCVAGTAASPAPALILGRTVSPMNLNGRIYQPRGAWTQLTSGARVTGPSQMISGAFDLGSNSQLTLIQPAQPPRRRVVALVQ